MLVRSCSAVMVSFLESHSPPFLSVFQNCVLSLVFTKTCLSWSTPTPFGSLSSSMPFQSFSSAANWFISFWKVFSSSIFFVSWCATRSKPYLLSSFFSPLSSSSNLCWSSTILSTFSSVFHQRIPSQSFVEKPRCFWSAITRLSSSLGSSESISFTSNSSQRASFCAGVRFAFWTQVWESSFFPSGVFFLSTQLFAALISSAAFLRLDSSEISAREYFGCSVDIIK